VGGKNWRFSTEIAVYLGNGARWADSYYGTLIGGHGVRSDGIIFDDLECHQTRVSRSLYTYKSTISKMVHFRDKVTK